MNPETLVKKLNFPKAYRKVRLDIARWVIEHPETFPQLLDICFKSNDNISYKAAWILEFVCIEKLELLLLHLDLFFKNLPKVQKDQAVRPFSKICLMLVKQYYKKKDDMVINSLQPRHKKAMTECCFDWLITDQKVACQAFSMDALYLLGTEIEWIHPELKVTLEQNIHSQSAAYCARGRITLEKIKKFKRKTHNS